MILKVMKNSALAAKIHAMSGSALKSKDYDALMQLRSVPAVAAYLAENTRYKSVLEKTPVSVLHRGQLEQLLKSQTLNDIVALLHYADASGTFLLKVLEIQDGIEKLKVFLRLMHINKCSQIAEYTFDIPFGNEIIKAEDLAGITSFSGLLDFLKPTPYYQALKSFSGDPVRQDLFYLEVALDTYWAKVISQYTKKYLSPDEAKISNKTYGTEIDLDNLAFLLRCTERFKMSSDEIYACIVPSYYRLKQSTVTKIVNCDSPKDAYRIISSETPYGDAFSPSDRFLEKRKNDYMAKLHKRVLSVYPYSSQAAISYIHLRRIEINNIVSVIEGIRYGLEPKQIKEYLIGYDKGDAEK